MIPRIQPTKKLTRVYTLDWSDMQNGCPKDVIPWRANLPRSSQNSGPPLSPWHVLVPVPPAHNWKLILGMPIPHLRGS